MVLQELTQHVTVDGAGWSTRPWARANPSCSPRRGPRRSVCAALRRIRGRGPLQPRAEDLVGWSEIQARVQEWMPQTDPFGLAGANHALQELDPRTVAEAMAAFLVSDAHASVMSI
jgi:hypothetical protein